MSRLIQTKGVAPSAPAANKVSYFTNTTTKRLNYIDDGGVTGQVGGLNSWYDATDYGLKGDDSTDNLAAFNTLYTLIPANSTIYFPAGTYRFSAELTVGDKHLTIRGAGNTQSLLKTTSATAHLFNFSTASWYWSFRDIGFRASVNKTAGAYINMAFDGPYLAVENIEMQGYFQGINLASSQAGNLGLITNSFFNSPSTNGTAITINGSTINLMISNVNINSGTVAGSVGVLINQCGAIQIDGCDFIGGVNCLLVTATGVVSAILATNTFFDQSTLGSTVKFAGSAGAISRVKFVECGMTCGTTGSVGLVAVEIAGTGVGTTIPEGLDFINCDLYNNSGGGTTIGFLVTGCKSFSVQGCRISGFTRGFDITPYNTAGFTRFDILNNTIGATENFSGNGTGIILNAGSVAYGSFQIDSNYFVSNTTNITDNSSFPSGTASLYGKQIRDNIGSVPMGNPGNYTATAIPLTTVTNVDSHGGMIVPIPYRPFLARIKVLATNAATAQTLTATVRYGTANTNADTAVFTQAFTAGTAAVGSGLFIFTISIPTATTLMAFMEFFNGNNAATGIAGVTSLFSGLSTLATISTAANNWLGVYFSSATAGAITIRSVNYEIVSQ